MREREPEAPEPTNKHHRAEDKKPQAPHAVPGPHLQSNNNHEVESGRPSSPSNVVSRLAPLHSPPPAQLAPEQPKQGTRPHPVLKLNPPKKKLPDPAGPSGPTSSPSETSTCYSQKAARYDVDPAVSATGDPETPDLERWGAVSGAPEFIRSAAGLVDGGWIGVRPLGKGGNGIAGLWEMRDGDGGVIKVRRFPRSLIDPFVVIDVM